MWIGCNHLRLISMPAAVVIAVAVAGVARAQTANIPRTEDGLSRALAGDPNDQAARLQLAELLVQQKAYDDAIDTLAPIIRIDPQESRDLLRAEIQLRLGNVDDARTLCTRAIERRETSFARAQLGRIQLALHQYSRATDQLQRALELGDQNPHTHAALGIALTESGNPLGETLTISAPNGVPGRIAYGHYLIERTPGRVSQFIAAPPGSAVYHLQRAVDAGIDTLEIKLAFGHVWLHAHHSERAAQVFESIESVVRESGMTRMQQADFYHDYAEALLGADQIEAYLERFRQAVYLDPKRYGPMLVDAYQKAGRKYVQRGDVRAYVDCLQNAVIELPDSPDLHYLLGNALWESGRTADAVSQWQATLSLRPGHPDRNRMLELMDAFTETPAP